MELLTKHTTANNPVLKIVAAILFVLFPVLGFAFGIQYGVLLSSNQKENLVVKKILPIKNSNQSSLSKVTSNSSDFYYESSKVYQDFNYDVIIKFPDQAVTNSKPYYDKDENRANDGSVKIGSTIYYLENLQGWVGGIPPCGASDSLCKSEYIQEIKLDIKSTENPTFLIKGNKEGVHGFQINNLAKALGLSKSINNWSILNSIYIIKESKGKFSNEEINLWKKVIESLKFEAVPIKK